MKHWLPSYAIFTSRSLLGNSGQFQISHFPNSFFGFPNFSCLGGGKGKWGGINFTSLFAHPKNFLLGGPRLAPDP